MDNFDEDEELDKIYKEKQQQELIDAISSLVKVIRIGGEKDNKVSDIIIQNNRALDTFLQKIQSLQKPDSPRVVVNNKNDELLEVLGEFNLNMSVIKDAQNKIISLLSIKPKTMVINRNYGIISSIDIQYDNINTA